MGENILNEEKIVQAVMSVLQREFQLESSQKTGKEEKVEDVPDEQLKDIPAISEWDLCLVDNPKNREAIMRQKRFTPAKTATGRTGDREKTIIMYRKRAAHAAAVDAVWEPADLQLARDLNLPITKSLPSDKEEYLMRPDLGVRMDEENLSIIRTQLKKNPDVQLVIGEGQSNTALEKGLKELYPALIQGLEDYGIDYGTPVFVEYTRVGIGDLICQEVGAKMVCVILGERPGLLSWASMSCYITYGAKPGILESKRSVISNINEDGIPYSEAGAYAADIIKKMLEVKKSGTDLVL